MNCLLHRRGRVDLMVERIGLGSRHSLRNWMIHTTVFLGGLASVPDIYSTWVVGDKKNASCQNNILHWSTTIPMMSLTTMADDTRVTVVLAGCRSRNCHRISPCGTANLHSPYTNYPPLEKDADYSWLRHTKTIPCCRLRRPNTMDWMGGI